MIANPFLYLSSYVLWSIFWCFNFIARSRSELRRDIEDKAFRLFWLLESALCWGVLVPQQIYIFNNPLIINEFNVLNTPPWQCSSNDRPFFQLDHANLPVSDHTYIFCKLSFCQIVSEMIDFLGTGVRKWIPS